MPGVAWPQVRAYLAGSLVAAAVPSVRVFDGPVVSGENPPLYLTVAHQPSNPDEASGSFEQEVGPSGFSAAESGEVVCELAGTSGSADVPDVFATFAALAAHLQANQTLGGVLSANGTVTASADVLQEQTNQGAVQRLRITVTYTTWVV